MQNINSKVFDPHSFGSGTVVVDEPEASLGTVDPDKKETCLCKS